MSNIEQLLKKKNELEEQIVKAQTQLPFIDVSVKGKPKPTKKNFMLLMDTYDITIRHNEMTKEVEITVPGKHFHSDTEINSKFAYIVDLMNTNDLSTKDLEGLVTMIANENSYHPVRDWIDSLGCWDGVDRLPDFYSTIEIINENDDNSRKLKEIMMRKWVLSGVAALYHTNFSLEGVLTFSGAQGQGKTTWGYNLFPKEHCMNWVKDAVVLDFKNKDSIMKALGYWLVELGELDATFRKADIENLKGFITEKHDVIRPPYERKANRYSRRTFMYATVNGLEFLNDEENRRFWVLHINKINMVKFDVGQFWTQIKHEYMLLKDKINSIEDRIENNEYGWFLSSDERKLLNRQQQIHKVTDPIVQKLEVRIMPKDKMNMNEAEKLNATQILERIGLLNVTGWQARKAGTWLREQGFEQHTSNKLYVVQIVENMDYTDAGPTGKVLPWNRLKSGASFNQFK